MGKERRIGRDDADDRPGARDRLIRLALIVVPPGVRARDGRERDRLTDRDAVHPEPFPAAVVGLDEDADGVPAPGRVDDARCRADPALELMADHPRPAPDVAFGDGSVAGRRERRIDVVGGDVEPVDVVQQPVPGLAHDRQRPVRRPERQLPHGIPDDPVTDHADGVRVRDPDRTREVAGLADPFEPGQLAIPVEPVASGMERLGPDVAIVGHDHRHAGSDGTAPHDERSIAPDERRVAHPNPGDVRDGVGRPRHSMADGDPQVSCAHPHLVAPDGPTLALPARGPLAPATESAVGPYHRRVIHRPGKRSAVDGSTSVATTSGASPTPVRVARTAGAVRLDPLPFISGMRPIDVAEAFRDLPGLALLESARPGRNARWSYLAADPIAVLTEPAAGSDPFAVARRLLARLAATPVRSDEAPPFLGGLVGYLGYELGDMLERLPRAPADDQGLPLLRLALHDWVIAWDRRTQQAWLGGRALDGDIARLDRRLAEVHRRLGADHLERAIARGAIGDGDRPRDGAEMRFVSSLDRRAYEAGVEAIRDEIGGGAIYQANLTRRLAAPFTDDPWPLYRRLRTGDPSLFSAFLDLGPGAPGHGSALGSAPARPRAILSASPEPFLAVTPDGHVSTDPIKGTRPRGRTPAEDRDLARELLASTKDRAENVMIVDVLRNDLGRVCRPGSVRVPRLCRLERTAAVQHLVSTVTGELSPGRDAFDLLAAAFPGGSITGAPKIRAQEVLRSLEPTRRGPYTGALGWFGPDGAMATSILIRTFIADGAQLTLHVGGGITGRSDPAAEWAETVAKSRGPLGAIGATEPE